MHELHLVITLTQVVSQAWPRSAGRSKEPLERDDNATETKGGLVILILATVENGNGKALGVCSCSASAWIINN